jgi:predicted metal-dependent phosphoesterase TrpH
MSRGATLAIDLHVHSEGSYDARTPVTALLEHASETGLDGVVVTDHDAIDQSLEAAALAPTYGLIGIPGVEISTAHGHLLAIGVERLPEPHRPFDETIARIRKLGGVAVVPHPFQRSRHGVRKRRLERVDPDAIEVYNPWLFTGYENRRAKRYARTRSYPQVAGSDAHLARMVGRAYTEITTEKPVARVAAEDVVEALAAGATAIHGRRQPILRSARHYLTGATRKANRAFRHGVTALF